MIIRRPQCAGSPRFPSTDHIWTDFPRDYFRRPGSIRALRCLAIRGKAGTVLRPWPRTPRATPPQTLAISHADRPLDSNAPDACPAVTSAPQNGRVSDWRGNDTVRGVAVVRRSRCLSPRRMSRFQSLLVEPDVQSYRIRLSRVSLRPSLLPRQPDSREGCRGRVSRRDTRPDTGDIRCLASLVVGSAIAADGARCTAGSPDRLG